MLGFQDLGQTMSDVNTLSEFLVQGRGKIPPKNSEFYENGLILFCLMKLVIITEWFATI